MGRAEAGRFARVGADVGRHVPADELRARLAAGDALVAMTAFEGVQLSGDAGGATFERVVFRDCSFDSMDLSRCTFTDVAFEGCRFVRCDMGRSWLHRVDFRSCSAPGLSLREGRLTDVSFDGCQLRYADLSETSVERLVARDAALAESAWHSTRLRRFAPDRCDLSRAEFFRTPLRGVDLTTCDISGIVVSSDWHELRGARVSPEQAVGLAELLGVVVEAE